MNLVYHAFLTMGLGGYELHSTALLSAAFLDDVLYNKVEVEWESCEREINQLLHTLELGIIHRNSYKRWKGVLLPPTLIWCYTWLLTLEVILNLQRSHLFVLLIEYTTLICTILYYFLFFLIHLVCQPFFFVLWKKKVIFLALLSFLMPSWPSVCFEFRV